MKHRHLIPTPGSAALAAVGLLVAAGSSQAAMVTYYIGVDGLEAIPSGEFAGQPNPNYNRLTFLYAHPSENPASNHYHSKAIYRYQPGSAGSPIVEQSPSNYLPEGSNPPLAFTAGSGVYDGKSVVLEDPGNIFSLIDIRDTGDLSTYAPGTPEHYMFNSSGGRWTGNLAGGDVHLVLVSLTPGLNIGNSSSLSIGLTNPGDEYHLGESFDFSPVFWMEADAAPGSYVAQFMLADENDVFGDSGTFEFRFEAVPEPSTAVLAGMAAFAGLIRRRR